MFVSDEPVKIDEHLYLGNFSAATYDSLLKNDITSVVCLTKDSHSYPNSVTLFHLNDISENLTPESFSLAKLEQAVSFIEQQIAKDENVLVHCMAGASRSPTVIIAYLIKQKSFTVDQACKYVKEKSSNINPTFIDLLNDYYNTVN